MEESHFANARAHGAPKRIAVVTMGVKLGSEERGYTRFRKIAEMLCAAGFEVDLFTSSFQHWYKAQRNTSDPAYQGLPYRIVFVEEPGYRRNLDPERIMSHAVAAKNLRNMLEARFSMDERAYDLVYAEIPPNDVARAACEVAREHGVPFVADINDLWPEAMRMVVDLPVVSDVAFEPFASDARAVYRSLSAAVGTSDEYALRPAEDRAEPYRRLTVYVGNDLAKFDAGAKAHAGEVTKPEGEVWAAYAGTLGASYDIATLIDAAALCARVGAGDPAGPAARIRVKIMGDGPDRARLEARAAELGAPVEFLGYTPYDRMAAVLEASDITVNSLVRSAPQSIVTKIGDYLASGKPMVNTGSSREFREKVSRDGFGVNVAAEDPVELAGALIELAAEPAARKAMGKRARAVAEEQFDQDRSYRAIVELVRSLTS